MQKEIITPTTNEYLLKIPKKYINTQKGIMKETCIIDATGGNLNMNQNNDKFVKSLLNKKIAIPNPHGGLEISSNDHTLNNNNYKNIYLIGQLSKGDLFSTNAFWFNARVANKIANHLIGNLI